jgi:hypothetical protein
MAGLMILTILLSLGCTSPSGEEQETGEQPNAPPELENAGRQGLPAEQQTGQQQEPPQGQDPEQDNVRSRRNWTVPQEAFDACSSKANGSTCSYVSNQGEVIGTCRTGRDGRTICASDRMRADGNFSRSFTEASQACQEKNDGDACTFSMNDRALQGTCTKRGEELSCMPSGGPGGSQRPPGAPQRG